MATAQHLYRFTTLYSRLGVGLFYLGDQLWEHRSPFLASHTCTSGIQLSHLPRFLPVIVTINSLHITFTAHLRKHLSVHLLRWVILPFKKATQVFKKPTHAFRVVTHVQRELSRTQRAATHAQREPSRTQRVATHVQREPSRTQRAATHAQRVLHHTQRAVIHA